MNKVLIAIPAYNESENIEKVVDNIINNYPQYDYVVINDGSYDATRRVCIRRGYNLLNLPVNLGLSGAIKSGFKYANYYRYEYMVQLDGDGQHNPEYIADMLECMERTECDIVIGSRFLSSSRERSLRMVGNSLIEWLIRVTTGQRITDPTSGMRLFNRRMIREFGYNINYGPEPDTIAYLINKGTKIREIQVTMNDREYGDSYLTLSRSIRYMINVVYSIIVFQWLR